MVKLTGGGISGNKVVQSKAGKQEPISHKGSPAGVAQLGAAVQFKKEEPTSGKGYQPYGAKDHTAQGPGAMRTIHRSGSQGLHGPVAQGSRDRAPDVPATSTKGAVDILSQYGPERRGR
jgi:hypothetical protein